MNVGALSCAPCIKVKAQINRDGLFATSFGGEDSNHAAHQHASQLNLVKLSAVVIFKIWEVHEGPRRGGSYIELRRCRKDKSAISNGYFDGATVR